MIHKLRGRPRSHLYPGAWFFFLQSREKWRSSPWPPCCSSSWSLCACTPAPCSWASSSGGRWRGGRTAPAASDSAWEGPSTMSPRYLRWTIDPLVVDDGTNIIASCSSNPSVCLVDHVICLCLVPAQTHMHASTVCTQSKPRMHTTIQLNLAYSAIYAPSLLHPLCRLQPKKQFVTCTHRNKYTNCFLFR